MNTLMHTSMTIFMRALSSVLSFLLMLLSLPFCAAQSVHATAQCESLNSNVLGIKDLKVCDIGVTNYGATPVVVTEAMIREWFSTLSLENPRRAKAVADKAFNSSKKSRAIAAFNFISPLAISVMGGGLIGFSTQAALKAVVATSLANTALQSFKGYLIGQQPDESAFLPDLPPFFTLGPYGSIGGTPFSVVYTVLGSIDYTSGSMNSSVSSTATASMGMGKKSMAKPGKAVVGKGPVLDWRGDLPGMPGPVQPTGQPLPHLGLGIEHLGLGIESGATAWETASDKNKDASPNYDGEMVSPASPASPSYTPTVTITSGGMTLRIIPQQETLGLLAVNMAMANRF